MLTLGILKGEKIAIGDDCVIFVREVRGDKVTLGIQAPKYIPVFREKVLSNSQWQDIEQRAVSTDTTSPDQLRLIELAKEIVLLRLRKDETIAELQSLVQSQAERIEAL